MGQVGAVLCARALPCCMCPRLLGWMWVSGSGCVRPCGCVSVHGGDACLCVCACVCLCVPVCVLIPLPGKPTSKILDEAADSYTFIAHQLGAIFA